jgi:hypothetical protein
VGPKTGISQIVIGDDKMGFDGKIAIRWKLAKFRQIAVGGLGNSVKSGAQCKAENSRTLRLASAIRKMLAPNMETNGSTRRPIQRDPIGP